MEWRPIETAPKGRTEIFLFWPEYNGNYPFIGYWVDNPYGGFWIGKHTASGMKGSDPTHWMPLPDPPRTVEG